MNHTAERNERHGKRHAMVLAISLHLALVAMLYFKTSNTASAPLSGSNVKPELAKVNPAPKAKMVKLP